MSVVGFDFGSSKCVVAVARKHGIDVLQNEVGHRATPSMVAFSNKQRFIGNEAVAQVMSNPSNSVNNMKRFLGRRFDDGEIKMEGPFTNVKVVENAANRWAAFEVNYDGKKELMTPEQVSGALFQKLKGVAERGLDGKKVSDCVIGCPSWWTDQQRRALLDAANVAGLNVLRLMNETTAIGLNYGILRPLPKDKEQKVLFFDLGFSSLNIALISFVEGKLTVLGTASDRSCGGRDFDELLVRHFAEYIKTKYKMDVTKDTKAMLKLRKECERVKLNLSANTKVPFNVEYIMNDRDVSGMIERAEFEELAAKDILPRIVKPVKELLDRCGVKKEELASIEVVGGSVRIPAVQKCLIDFLGRDVSKTCDGDESVARGCALMCAMISPSFKVKEFEVVDVSPYPIRLEWGPKTATLEQFKPDDSTDLFTVNNPIPSVKLISFNDRTEPFQIVARYSNPEGLPPVCTPLLGRFVISGMPKKDENKKIPKIKVRVKINLHGVLQVTSAQVLEEIPEPPAPTPATAPTAAASAAATSPAADKVEDTSMADAADTKAANDAAKAASQDGNSAGEAKMDTSADGPTSPNPQPSADGAPAGAATPTPPVDNKPKVRVRKEDLNIDSQYTGGVDQKTLQAWFEKEAAMNNQDRVVFETNQARNDLEGYVLEMRNQISDALAPYIKDEDKAKFNSLLDDTESWLYGDGSDAQKSDYKKKLSDLKALGDPVQQRLSEAERREEFVQQLKSSIFQWQNLTQTKEEKYSHIGEDDRKKVSEECGKADQWIVNLLIQQDRTPKYDNPVVTCTQIKQKRDEIEKLASGIFSKPKPAPPKPAPAPAAAPQQPAADGAKPADASAAGGGAAPKTEPMADQTNGNVPPKEDNASANGTKPMDVES